MQAERSLVCRLCSMLLCGGMQLRQGPPGVTLHCPSMSSRACPCACCMLRAARWLLWAAHRWLRNLQARARSLARQADTGGRERAGQDRALEQAKKLKEKDAKRDFEKQARAPHMHAPGVRVWNVQHGSRLSRGQLESRALAALDCKQLSSVTSTSLQLLPQYMLCT